MTRWEGAEVLMGDENDRPPARVWSRAELDRALYGERTATKGARNRATLKRTKDERDRARHKERDREGKFT